jgi:hypothetical protein
MKKNNFNGYVNIYKSLKFNANFKNSNIQLVLLEME